ncbi:uncharacterized protein LOC128292647 [Gossypium arboreum]|uniref:uncharacterized protein LOC128292647 n=1 Tax=Gossypium arboreum TaxID=29729 RepID=UPI0022F1789E|nr:uncharacterized protein LOC128292647 [Gossypium arboreum]
MFYWTRVECPSIWGKRLTDFNCVRHFPSSLHPGKFYKLCFFVFYLPLFLRISFLFARMGKGNKEGTSKQFRWTKLMEHFFLEILAEEAQKGNKPSNTFKTVSINQVDEAISEKFQVQCDAKHVESHLRTIKNSGRLYAQFGVKMVLDWMIT